MGNNFVSELLEFKYSYDSICQAIKIAKNLGMESETVKPMIVEKQAMKQKLLANNSKLLKTMNLNCNVKELGDEWYAVRYVDSQGNTTVKLECLRKEDIHYIMRDGRIERELNKSQLDSLSPAIRNEGALENYKRMIRHNAYKLITKFTGEEVAPEEETSKEVTASTNTVSFHCGVRWVQRILSIKDEDKARDYYKLNMEEVNQLILESFEQARCVWSSEGVNYLLNEESVIMFVQGTDKVIVTMYEEDFGFGKDINRMITLEQIKVLEESYEQFTEKKQIADKKSNQVNQTLQSISDEIDLLESQIETLVAKRATINAERNQDNKEVRMAKARYDAEFNKLFKKWEA